MDMFKPELTLTRDAKGTYTLHALTLTPNSCYGAGRATVGAPPNVRLIPEAQPVMLQLTHHRGFCLEVVTPVRHRLRHLKLDGKVSVIAFVMLGDKMVGSASVPVHDARPGDTHPVETHGWHAWVNRMPPGPPSFHVQGIVTAPTPGYEASLAYAEPQGINPRGLILDLHLKERPGLWPALVTALSVRYDVANYDGNYDSVLVRIAGGEAVQMDVEEVV